MSGVGAVLVPAGGFAAAFAGRIAVRFAVSGRVAPSRPGEQAGPAHVVDGGGGEEAGRVPVPGPALGAAQPVKPLEGGEHGLDRGAPSRDQSVAALLPMGQRGYVLVPPVHDPVLDPPPP